MTPTEPAQTDPPAGAPFPAELLRVLDDGTVKQVNPFTGTQVWTVPGRGHRPLAAPTAPRPVVTEHAGRHCAFCEHRYLETPPEKARVVRDDDGWRTRHRVDPDELFREVAEFRRIPNLFEIVSFDYWHRNHGHVLAPGAREHRDRYLGSAAGRSHALHVAHQRWAAGGRSDDAWESLSEEARLANTDGFFGGGHDVIVGRRHFIDGATDESQLASAGTLTPDEHAQYVGLTVEAMRDLYETIPAARYVAAFQNWLKPAGASFDHLHKQLVAIDEPAVQTVQELHRLRSEPDLYETRGVGAAAEHDLLVAENEHAVAFAGIGHRYPSLELYSKADRTRPWEHSPEQRRGVSDLLHALHAASGPGVPCNEEWHHQPLGVAERMPWRIVVKWRVSTLAGFEGGTRIYLNTIDPWDLRLRATLALRRLREEGVLAPGISLGEECARGRPRLRYHDSPA